MNDLYVNIIKGKVNFSSSRTTIESIRVKDIEDASEYYVNEVVPLMKFTDSCLTFLAMRKMLRIAHNAS